MRLRWTKSALSDLNHAYAYIAADNHYAARDIIKRIERALEIIASYPDSGRIGRCGSTRELVVAGTPFLIPYRIRKNTVDILAVIHHSRRWPKRV